MRTWSDIGISIPEGRTGEVYLHCPKCSRDRKKQNVRCLSANTDEGVWFCHHCNWSGSLKAGEWKRAEIKREWTRPTYIPATPTEKMFGWFAKRGITQEVVVRNRISIKTIWMPQSDKESAAMAFPYYRNGECLNVKYRDHLKNFRMESNAEQTFYGLDDMDEVVVVVEGEMDKLAVEVAGIVSCVSVPAGAPNADSKEYSSKFDFLENSKAETDKVSTFILAVDSDANGAKLEEELARRLGMGRCKRVKWPSDCKDANDVLLKHGADALRQHIEAARHFPIDGVFTVSDFEQDIDAMYARGFQRGDLIGIDGFDDLYSVVAGELTVVTGVPNHGKSEFLDFMLMRLTQRYGHRFAIFSPENQPLAYHFFKLAEKYIGKPGFGKGKFSEREKDRAKEWIGEHFRFVLPAPEERSVEKILRKASEVVARDGIRGLICDPWNEFEHQRPLGLTENEYIGWALMRVKEFAKQHGVHVWIVAHPTKMKKDLNLKKDYGIDAYEVPMAYDISGSSNWNNKAEVVMSVYRWMSGALDGQVDVHIQKCRFKGTGKKGVSSFSYDVASGLYCPMNGQSAPVYDDLPPF